MTQIQTLLIVVLLAAMPRAAQAQISQGTFRFSLDTDIVSFAGVHIVPASPASDVDVTVLSIGPNQLGASRALRPATPLGVGFGYALTRRVLLGVRVGLGYDVLSYDAGGEDVKVLALSVMPGLTFVPLGNDTKLFIQVSPLVQLDRERRGERRDRVLLGGFSLGLGALVFAGSRTSVDIGGFFEGRWGSDRVDTRVGAGPISANVMSTVDVRDLRGIVRFGLSLWR